jgi:hypothetical protein
MVINPPLSLLLSCFHATIAQKKFNRNFRRDGVVVLRNMKEGGELCMNLVKKWMTAYCVHYMVDIFFFDNDGWYL